MTGPLPARISTRLPVLDPARADRARERIGPEVLEGWGEGARFLDAVFAAAPYLARLAARRSETLRRLAETSPETLIEEACAALAPFGPRAEVLRDTARFVIDRGA